MWASILAYFIFSLLKSKFFLRITPLEIARMSRSAFWTALALALLLTSAPRISAAESNAKSAKPNIIYILSDDQGYGDTGFNGGKEVKTPHLDALAASGAVLESFYVQPVCSPTRAALMTGRHVIHTGVYYIVPPGAPWGLPLEERTLAQALREAGYFTAECGKWHLGEFEPAYRPTHRGFDRQYGPWLGAIDCFSHLRDGRLDWHRDDQPSHDRGYSTHLLAQEACRIIREKPTEKPLFLYLPFNAVHGPLQAPAEYFAHFPHLKGNRQKYAAMLWAMDEAVGQIMAALEATGLRENTLIVFSSDNGGPDPGKTTSNGPLRAGKGTLYEGGVRVCSCASWPARIPAGKRIAEPLHVVDWYPTFVKLAGGSLQQKLPLDGLDILPVLTEGAKSPHEILLLPGTTKKKAALRKGDWKLIVGGKQGLQLYNLADDLGEKRNVADEHPQIVAELQAHLDEQLKDAVPFAGEGKHSMRPPRKQEKS